VTNKKSVPITLSMVRATAPKGWTVYERWSPANGYYRLVEVLDEHDFVRIWITARSGLVARRAALMALQELAR